jgi:hypothetical protein
MAQIRSWYRAAVFVHLAVVLLSAVGVHEGAILWRQWRRTLPGPNGTRPGAWRRGWTVIGQAGLVASAVALVAQAWPPRPGLVELPGATREPSWAATVRDFPRAGPIATVPFPDDVTVQAFEPTARAMVEQPWHGRPLVGGYSGIFPRSYQEMVQRMSTFPNEASLEALRARGVVLLVVERSDDEARGLSAKLPALGARPIEMEDQGEVRLYELPAAR